MDTCLPIGPLVDVSKWTGGGRKALTARKDGHLRGQGGLWRYAVHINAMVVEVRLLSPARGN
jgi:hypothetical protein